MTFNHQNKTTNGFSSKKSHRKDVLHLLVELYVTNQIFRLLDLEIEVLTLKMTFNYQNNTRNGLLNQNHFKHRYYTSCYLCLLKIIFFYTFDLEINLLTLKITLKMNYKWIFQSKFYEMMHYTCSYHYFLEIIFLFI